MASSKMEAQAGSGVRRADEFFLSEASVASEGPWEHQVILNAKSSRLALKLDRSFAKCERGKCHLCIGWNQCIGIWNDVETTLL